MKRHARIMTAILSAILLVSAFTVTASAEDVPGGEISIIDDNPASDAGPITPEPGGDSSDPITPEPQQPSYVEPSQQSQDSYVEPAPQDSYVEPAPQDSYIESYVEPDNNNNNDNNYDSSNVYYDADGNTYSDVNDVYVGGDQTYSPPASTAPSAPLYDTSKTKVDDKTLTDSDWKDIKAKLTGAGNKKSDGGDFAFIQNNNSSEDNGHLIFILGIVLIVLSVAGFTYLIVSASMRRKKTALAHAGKAAGKANGKQPHNGARYRSNADYDDDFSNDSRKKSSKPKNGRRYK